MWIPLIMKTIPQKAKFFLSKNSSTLLYFVIHLNCTDKYRGIISLTVLSSLCYDHNCTYSECWNLTLAISKHEQPSGLSFTVKTQPGPNRYCSELFLSDPQQTHGLRNKRANLYQKTYSDFRSYSTWTTQLSLIFLLGQNNINANPPWTEKARCPMCIQTLHIWPSFTLCEAAKTSNFISFYWCGKRAIRRRAAPIKSWGVKGEFLMDIVYSFQCHSVASHWRRKPPLRQRPPHCCAGDSTRAKNRGPWKCNSKGKGSS